MKLKTEITTVGDWHTLLCENDKGQKIAALVFPSLMETTHSASRCSVDFNSGELKLPTPKSLTSDDDNITTFITDATAMEMDDCLFRLACLKNYTWLKTHTFKPYSTSQTSFTRGLMDWLYCIPEEYTMCRIFGGDLIKTEMLECICEAFGDNKCGLSKTFYMYTSRIDILNDIYKKNVNIPSNVYIYARKYVHDDNIPVHNFPTVDIGPNSTGDLDLNTYPWQMSNISIRLGDDNDTKLRTKQPWFQL